MRTLSSTLLAAQKSVSASPYLHCTVRADVASLPRLAWSRYYSGAEPDAHHALVFAGDGSLIRARAGATSIEVMRIANPGAGSTYSAWTALGVGTGTLCLAASGATVVLLCVPNSSGDIYEVRSASYGASWSAPSLVQTLGSAGAPVAAGFKNASTLRLFYAVGGVVSAKPWTSGSWGTPATWTNSAVTITGLAACYRNDWGLLVTGTDTAGNQHFWSTIYGDGYAYGAGVWGPLESILTAGPASAISYGWPAFAFADTYRGTVIESYSGAGGVSRPYLATHIQGRDAVEQLWLEPSPFDATSGYGISIAFDPAGSAVWLAKPSGAWRAPLVAAPSADLSTDVLHAEVEERAGRGRAVIEVRNDGGQYSAIGAGSLGALTLGARLDVAPGYRTASGDEASPGGPAYFITALEHVFRNGRAVLRIEAEDGWWWLDAWRAQRSLSFPIGSKNVFQLIATFAARAGFDLIATGITSAVLDTLEPAFHLAPGESAASAVRRLLASIPEVAQWTGARLVLRQALASDPSAYGYGGSGEHPVLAGRRLRATPAINHARVVGPAGAIGEAFDFASLALVSERAGGRTDPFGSAAAVAEVAIGLVREAAALTPAGAIEVPVNCGQELWDVITITLPQAGWTAPTTARVTGLRLEYEREPDARYRQVITLGGV